MKILLLAGARPNFMKIAPLIHELRRNGRGIDWKVVHTGQHYDFELSHIFFKDLDIGEPDYYLNAASGTHAEQTAKIMVEFEKVCLRETPDIVVVVGDVNSTLACSITAKKLNIRVAHVEAGLRSGDMTMPEEVNRIVTDSISDYLFVTEKSGIENLKKEGKHEGQIYFVGNIMIDSLLYCLQKLKNRRTDNSMTSYALVTLHRPSNVDSKEKLEDILRAVKEISKELTILFPMHPRTIKNIEKYDLNYLLEDKNIKATHPASYIEFLSSLRSASLVLTDSGGIQEESTVLGIPCFTIRENTERPVTIEKGTNTLVGCEGTGILKAYDLFRKGNRKKGEVPELWDGRTAERIVKILAANN